MNCNPTAETPGGLNRIIRFAQQFLAEVLSPGGLAVDLTAGNGHDTLFLYQCTGSSGRILAFDVQQQALDQTARRLIEAGAEIARINRITGLVEKRAPVQLIHDSHARLGDYLNEAPDAIMANLGYLPGGDKSIVTTPSSTISALDQSAGYLAAGGRIAVVVYVGHEDAINEKLKVEQWFSELSPQYWFVLRMSIPNRSDAPFLLVAEKRV